MHEIFLWRLYDFRFCIKNVNDERVFIILYAVSAVYFAGVMVRLMLTLTPCVCILAAIAFSRLFELYLKEDETSKYDCTNSKPLVKANDLIWLFFRDSSEDSSEGGDKNGRLYDKAGKIRKMKHEQKQQDEGLGGNLK